MEKEDLGSIASHLIASYSDTAVENRKFREEHGSPMTLMAKVHYMRSVMIARLIEDDDYELAPQYVEFGKVQFTENNGGLELLLRSAGALQVELASAHNEQGLFSVAGLIKTTDVKMVVYKFTKDGVELSVAPTVERPGKKRLLALGEPVFVGLWLYTSADDETKPFDQDYSDPFNDIGEIGHEDGEEGAV